MTRAMLFIIILIFSMGCQTGRIPCPKGPKASKPKKYKSYGTLMARAQQPVVEDKTKQLKKPNPRYIQSVSVEEWDCPEPGKKKYLPRNVKSNIKRNYKRIQNEQVHAKRDSL
jgi:hypothetical protein